jgi:hypothetical protein
VKKLASIWFGFAVAVGGIVVQSAVVRSSADQATNAWSGQRQEISDAELKAFAKTYVEFQRIGLAYENSLNHLRDRQEGLKAQHEALIKIEAALQKQGLAPEVFAQIFETVNADETLRAKTMKLIEEERRAQS